MKYLFFSLVIIVFVSCKREGCTDPEAINYDYKVQIEDNSSCIFQDKGVDSNTVIISGVSSVPSSCSFYNPYRFKKVPGATIDYKVSCYLKFSGEVIIDPGVTIAFTENAGIQFSNKTTIVGSIDSMINFIPVNTYWKGAKFIGTPGRTTTINFLNISNAGSPLATNDTNFGYWSAVFYTRGNCNIRNFNIDNSLNGGVLFYSDSYDDYISNFVFDSVTISNCGVPLKLNHYGLISQLGTMSFINNLSQEIVLPIKSMGNDLDIHFKKYNAAYKLTTHESTITKLELGTNNFTADAGSNFIMGLNAQIISSNFITNGSFTCIGNNLDSITFVGEQNTVDYWKGIQVESNALNQVLLNYVTIENASSQYNSNMVISGSGGGPLAVTNSTFKNGSPSCGILSALTIDTTGTLAIGVASLICQ